MTEDIGVVTLCDSNYFPGLLMLHQSVQESHPCCVACYDAGLTPLQKQIAAGCDNLLILPLPDDPRIERIREAMSRTTPLRKVNKRIWPLWICPILILHAPFNQVIWMDCDVVVLRELANLFAAINEGPVFTPENKAPQCTPNSPELYELLPIRRAFNPLSPAVNAGVSGWRKDRDAEALAAYILPVERAIDDARLRDALSWHDQGALIWAIQCQGLEDRVSPSRTWNLCADHTSLLQRPIPWDSDFLPKARAKVRNANILHWNGSEPPWVTGSV